MRMVGAMVVVVVSGGVFSVAGYRTLGLSWENAERAGRDLLLGLRAR
jgi:hypothetical protein